MSRKTKIEPKPTKRSRRETSGFSSGNVEPNPAKYTWNNLKVWTIPMNHQ